MYVCRWRPGPFLSVPVFVPSTTTMFRPRCGTAIRPIGLPSVAGDGTHVRPGGRAVPRLLRLDRRQRTRLLVLRDLLQLVRQAALLPPRVERRERIVPLPDDERPRENDEPDDHQRSAEAPPGFLPRAFEAVSVTGVCAIVSIVERVDGEVTGGRSPATRFRRGRPRGSCAAGSSGRARARSSRCSSCPTRPGRRSTSSRVDGGSVPSP